MPSALPRSSLHAGTSSLGDVPLSGEQLLSRWLPSILHCLSFTAPFPSQVATALGEAGPGDPGNQGPSCPDHRAWVLPGASARLPCAWEAGPQGLDGVTNSLPGPQRGLWLATPPTPTSLSLVVTRWCPPIQADLLWEQSRGGGVCCGGCWETSGILSEEHYQD